MPKTKREKVDKLYRLLNRQNTVMEQLRKDKDDVYAERNKLVCALSKLFPASIGKHEESDTTWHKEWMNIIYIQLPTGQVSWHIHEDLLPLFAHLENKNVKWDGHSTEEKYERLLNLQDSTKES